MNKIKCEACDLGAGVSRLLCIFLTLANELAFQVFKVLIVYEGGDDDEDGKINRTSDSWGKVVTKATKSSQPALRLMGFGAWYFKISAPSLSAPTSSNIVPAFDLAINSVRARMAAMGIEI